MKIPTKIQIMGEVVNVQLSTHLTDDIDGLCVPEQNKILINKSASKQRRFVILCHEILHYCNALLGYQNKACNKEEYVEQLSSLLNQIIPQL